MIALRVLSLPVRGVRILKSGTNVIQVASLTGRGTRGEPLKLPKPFPYNDKKFRWYQKLFDSTMYKYSQENARIVVVEGPIGVGKTAVCKILAEEFDMFHIPQPTMDAVYILPSGYDLRQHDHEIPESMRSYDHKNFCVDPFNVKAAAWFQLNMQYLRFVQYMDAMVHLLNTGQGVVLERSFFSDYVFMKAMLEQKFISKHVAKAYNTIMRNTDRVFWAPHLIIYLDISVPVVQERIRTRNYSYEQKSPALTKAYLESLEKYWKQDYLKKARAKSEILIYDWTDGGDVEVVVDDIEKLDLHTMRRDKRFIDWWQSRKNLNDKRADFTNMPQTYERLFSYPIYECPDLFIPMSEGIARDNVLAKIPECKYDIGYNPEVGDSILSIALRKKQFNRRHPKYHLNYCLMKED